MKEKTKIIIADYNPIWSKQFEEIKTALIHFIDEGIIEIEHVGSTSIQGLKAKPIIDLDIIIKNDQKIMNRVIDQLSELGYIHIGDLGVSGREAFKKLNAKTPDLGTNKEWFEHHLYLCKKGSIGLENHLNFRNYLRTHPDKVKEYSQLKEALANKFPYDIDSYIDGKTDFIIDILNKAGMKAEDTKRIDVENKLKNK